VRRIPTVLVLLVAAIASCACGGEPRGPAPIRWVETKAQSPVGTLRAAVVERPARDRAWIEARWDARDHGSACELRLVLPDGVLRLEGDEVVPLAVEERQGMYRWLVEFPTGRPLDAVLRYCAALAEGMRVAELSVRLTGE
jgi:hypothetical protein